MLLAGGVPPGFVYGRTASAGGANFPPSNPNLPVSSNGTVLWSTVFRIARVPPTYQHKYILTSPHWSSFCSAHPPPLFRFGSSVLSLFSFPLGLFRLPLSSLSRRLLIALCLLSRRIQTLTLNHPPPPAASPPALSHPRGVGCFAERVSTLANPSNFWYRSRRLRSRLLPIGFLLRSLPSKRALAPKSPPTFQNTVHRRTLFDCTFLLGCFSYLTIIFLCSYCFVLFCLFFFFLLIFICFMILLLNPAPNTLNFVTCHAFYASGSASRLSTRAQGAIHPSLGRHGPSSLLYLRPLNYFLLALRRDHRLFPWLMHPRARSMPWSEQGIGDY
jgi:hypothetical protein